MRKPQDWDENKTAAIIGGGISKKARLELESKTGKSVVTVDSFLLKEQDIKKLK